MGRLPAAGVEYMDAEGGGGVTRPSRLMAMPSPRLLSPAWTSRSRANGLRFVAVPWAWMSYAKNTVSPNELSTYSVLPSLLRMIPLGPGIESSMSTGCLALEVGSTPRGIGRLVDLVWRRNL